MENSKTYILSKLLEIVNKVSEIKIIYKFDSFSKEHLIKVLPMNEYESNLAYQALEEELLFSFIDKFPHDNLVFLSSGDWIDVDNPDKVFVGLNYSEESYLSDIWNDSEITFKNNELFSISNIDDDSFFMSDVLDEFHTKIDLEPSHNIENFSEVLSDYYGQEENNTDCVFNDDSILDGQSDKSDKTTNHGYDTNCNCDNFALAA